MPVFAFTDIEGSTGLWEKHQDAMGPIIARHYAILGETLARHGGRIVKKTGDGVFAIFADPAAEQPCEALECALDLQRQFQAEPWPVIGELRVRMAFHCGQAEEMAGDFYGPTANRTARFMSLGWGGQILVSEALRKLARLPQGAQWLDLGVHQVKDLPEPLHMFSLAHPDLKLKEFPPLKSLSNRPHNLPQHLSPFIGRQRELKDIAALLAAPQNRLIILTGPGGTGKSRLGLQAAQENLGRFKHGAWLASLEGLSSPGRPEELAGCIAQSLKIAPHRQKGPREQILEYLKDKELLLILDPCENLGNSAGLILEILKACPGLRVLACSRRRLNLSGQSVLEVRGLDYPASAQSAGLDASACARLFIQQAQAVQPGFILKPEDRPPFLKICRVLQGLPLGLELAAGLARQTPLKALAEQLEKDLRFLESVRPDLPPRHRSLRALFDSSWALLSQEQRETLSSLSVFRGGFTLAAAQALFKVAPESLSGLADLSLLESAKTGRYSMAETARHFAKARLEEDPARAGEALDLHARYFCLFLKDRERNLMGIDQARAVAETRQEFPNILRAWDRAVEHGWARDIAQASRGLGLYTHMQGLSRDWEPRMPRALQFFEGGKPRALETLGWEETLSAQATLVCNWANYLSSLGKDTEAREKMEASLSLYRKAGDRPGLSYALVRMAILLGPEDERRGPLLEEAIALYQSQGDSNGAAWARRNLAALLCGQGRAAQGRPMLEECLAIFKKAGNQRETAWCLNSLGQLDLESGQDEAGKRGLMEARDLFLGLGDLETAAWTLDALGQAAIARGLWAEAKAPVEESMRLFGQIRHFRGWAQSLRGLCEVFAGLGNLDTAFKAVDQVIAEALKAGEWAEQAGALMQKGQLLARQEKFEEALAVMKESQSAFAKAGSALGQAFALESQACVRLKQGKPPEARALFQQASKGFAQAGSLEGEARLSVRLGDLESAQAGSEGGEASYQKALILSRQHKPGDYTLGALLGLAGLLNKRGRSLDALQLVLLCERCFDLKMMPVSETGFYEELAKRSRALLAQLGSRLMRSVIEEARARMAGEDARVLLKGSVEKYGS